MESTIGVLLFLCVACFTVISAKTNTAGNSDTSSHLNSDFNELSSNELSTEIDNCHEACLQKVRIEYLSNIYTISLKCVEHSERWLPIWRLTQIENQQKLVWPSFVRFKSKKILFGVKNFVCA